MEGWAVKRLLVGVVLASASPILAQVPAARLAPPTSPTPATTARASAPDPFQDEGKLPAARLGAITGAKVGDVPAETPAEEKYNWGAPRDKDKDRRATPTSRRSGRDQDDEDYDRRGARLREPARGRLTNDHGRRAGDLGAPVDAGPPPAWWPGREQDLADLREQFPAFGEDRDRLAFASDCTFNNYISPITNPFLAEDPRSVTELRPIFMYQSIPGSQYLFQGGNAIFLGGQARVAFTDRLSVVVHKLGGVSFNGTNPFVSGTSGLAEFWLGPKFVFWRNPDTQTIASFGLQFQLPIGSSGAFQDTGNLGLVPYVTFATPLGQTDYGTFQFMNVAGYHMGSDARRSDYFFDSIHVDLDAGDNHRFYPTLEANWFHYTSNGTERPLLKFEGRDLANIGGSASGSNYITLAPGFRYKFTSICNSAQHRVPRRRQQRPGTLSADDRYDLAIMIRLDSRRHEA